MTSSKPLVTFALFTYNQEKTVEAALISALSQEYSPLELIISDDCSSDRTIEIVRATLANYQGPASVVLLTNPYNMGVGPHVSRVLRAAGGELVVLAAGDDLSAPQRTSALVERWLKAGGGSAHLSSDATVVDMSNRVLRSSFHGNRRPDSIAKLVAGSAMPLGATQACTPDLITSFGDIPGAVRNDDWILPFRAGVVGRLHYVNAKLVSYRTSLNSISQNSQVGGQTLALRKKADYHVGLLAALDCMATDLNQVRQTAEQHLGPGSVHRLHAAIRQRRQEISFAEQLYRARSMRQPGRIASLLARHPFKFMRLVSCYINSRISNR